MLEKERKISGLLVFPSVFLPLMVLHCADIPRKPPLSIQSEKTLPAGWTDEPVIILQDSVQLTVEKKGNDNILVMTSSVWYRVQKETPNVIKSMYVYDCDSIECRPTVSVEVFYPDGSGEVLSSRQIIRTRYMKKEAFAYNKFINDNNLFLSEIILPRYRKGSIVHVSIERRYVKPEFVTNVIMRNEYNTLDKVISITKPTGLSAGIENGERLTLDTEQKAEGRLIRSTIHGSSLPKREPSYGIRNPEQWYCGLYFSIPPHGDSSFTWKQLGDFYLDLIQNSCKSTTGIDSIAHCFSNAPKDSLIRFAFRWVRDNIRYYGSWEKMYGWIPRCADEVLSRGYGDCKEMALILKEILSRNGQPADIALVSTPGNFQLADAYPGFEGANHAIVHILYRTEDLFIDPTEKCRDFAGSSYDCIGRKALILRKGSSFFTDIAPGSRFRNRVITHCAISQTNMETGWQLKGTIHLIGRCAQDIHEKIISNPNEKKESHCESLLRAAFHIAITKLEVTYNSDDSISIGFTADFNKNFLGVGKGGLILNTPSIYSPIDFYGDCQHPGPRFAYEIQQSDEWIVPFGFGALEHENRSCPYYSVAWKCNGSTVTRFYTAPFLKIESTSRPRYCEALKEKEAFGDATLWYIQK